MCAKMDRILAKSWEILRTQNHAYQLLRKTNDTSVCPNVVELWDLWVLVFHEDFTTLLEHHRLFMTSS
jgi:hypothetical protein